MTTDNAIDEPALDIDGPGDVSPLDRISAQDKLVANVVDDGPVPRIHGYAVHDDLARHYSFGESMLLTITGRPPSAEAGRAFEAALIFASPVSIAEAPAHATRLAHTVNSDEAGKVAVAATALTEQTRWLLDRHHEVIAWLEGRRQDFPDDARSADPGVRRQVDALRGAVGLDMSSTPVFDEEPALWPALLAVLWGCGLRSPRHLLLALVQARLTTTVIEACSVPPADLKGYPVNLPRFRYNHERLDDAK